MKVRVLSIGVGLLVVSTLIFAILVVDRKEPTKEMVSEKVVKIEKKFIVPIGFYFIKSTGKSARLLKEGEELRELTHVKRMVDGEMLEGFELPGLWYGEYEVAIDSNNTTLKFIVGNPGNKKTISDCEVESPGNENQIQHCLAEVIPLMVKAIGGKETRDLLLNKYSYLVGNKSGCGPWLGAYAQAVYNLHGLEGSLSMDFMTCRYSFLHYIIAIDSLKEGNFEKVTSFCRELQINGVALFEARDQCMLGYGFAGLFSMNYSIDKMVKLCENIDNRFSDFSKNQCYEGVFGAAGLKPLIRASELFEGKDTEVYESWPFMEQLPTYEFCDTVSEIASGPCYRYTLGNQVDEVFYNNNDEYKIKWLKGVNKHCRLSGDGCWYGLADAAFKALGDEPFSSFVSVPEQMWQTLVELCENGSKLSSRCIDRVTVNQINKTFSDKIIKKWCGFLLKTSSYNCNYEAIEQYRGRIAPANQYDPSARRVNGE